jgi:enediyne biosynthesis protein E8
MANTGVEIRNGAAGELSRRQFLQRAGALGLGAAIASALPLAGRLAAPPPAVAADPILTDATLQAFFDTLIPGRKATKTDLGNPIHPLAIIGVDPEPGAVEADALLLAHHPKIGFDVLEPAFLAELEARAAARLPRSVGLGQVGDFLHLDYEARQAVCLGGLAYSNPTRLVWEAAAAVPFAAFCCAATQINPTAKTACGYRVIGHPGIAPHGYTDFSFRRQLASGRTEKGYLP